MKLNELTPEEKEIIINKKTERAYTGEYDDFYKPGIYVCKQCNNPLYSSKAKFDAGCGWPSFDNCFENSIEVHHNTFRPRYGTEITCAKCGGHLGHIFEGEQFTDTNKRHCVNSLSIKFIPE